MKLVAAIIITGVTLTVALAGYDLIAMNSRVVSKYERNTALNSLRFQIKDRLACAASQGVICQGKGKGSKLVFKTSFDRDDLRWVKSRDLSSLMGTKGLKTVLNPYCDSFGALHLDYLVVRDDQPVLDPLTKRPTTWNSLYGGPVCFRGSPTIRWPE